MTDRPQLPLSLRPSQRKLPRQRARLGVTAALMLSTASPAATPAARAAQPRFECSLSDLQPLAKSVAGVAAQQPGKRLPWV